MEYKELLEESRNLLAMCVLIDKSGQCSDMVEKIDKSLDMPDVDNSSNYVNRKDLIKRMEVEFDHKYTKCPENSRVNDFKKRKLKADGFLNAIIVVKDFC